MKFDNDQITQNDYEKCGEALNRAIERASRALAYGEDMRSSRLSAMRDLLSSLSNDLDSIDLQ